MHLFYFILIDNSWPLVGHNGIEHNPHSEVDSNRWILRTNVGKSYDHISDGTIFAISDLYDSPTDPRSPLQLVATCRSYGVTTKFRSLEDAVTNLSSASWKKREVYMNQRVQEAAVKEQEKKERMAKEK